MVEAILPKKAGADTKHNGAVSPIEGNGDQNTTDGQMPAYYVPDGGYPQKKEYLRPHPKMIKGDPTLPDYYNVYEKYPKCQPIVLNQDLCGSCWAFASSGMLGDRFCVHSEGQIDVTLSVQDMINCDLENYGCSGGYFIPAIDFLQTDGTTSYNCLPYLNKIDTCMFQCKPDKKMTYSKYYCTKGSLKLHTKIEDI